MKQKERPCKGNNHRYINEVGLCRACDLEEPGLPQQTYKVVKNLREKVEEADRKARVLLSETFPKGGGEE